ncbi:MAG: hypothetical protein WCP35_13445 [Verrucomicrobiota bacterium]
MKNTVRFAMLSAALGLLSTSAAFAKVDCAKLVLSVKQAVAANPSATLQIVEKQVGITPSCACELVKAAIQGSKANVKLVAAIVETAATVAPEHRHLIGQCAVAVAPDAHSAVQAVLKKLEPQMKGTPEASSKNALPKEAKAKPTSNPLDFPGSSIEAYLSANSGKTNKGNSSEGGGSEGDGGSGSGSGGSTASSGGSTSSSGGNTSTSGGSTASSGGSTASSGGIFSSGSSSSSSSSGTSGSSGTGNTGSSGGFFSGNTTSNSGTGSLIGGIGSSSSSSTSGSSGSTGFVGGLPGGPGSGGFTAPPASNPGSSGTTGTIAPPGVTEVTG